MAEPGDLISSVPVEAPYLDPDGRTAGPNEDWEAGPIAVNDTSQGAFYQAWKLTYSEEAEGGTFTITPETTGSPVVVLSGQNSIQCTLAFDQNARPAIAWENDANQSYLYWYDSEVNDFVITPFATQVYGLALCLDDKRQSQFQANNIRLYYTLPSETTGGEYQLWMRKQIDRYTIPYPQKEPVWPYIKKLGMHEALRVQIQLSTEFT